VSGGSLARIVLTGHPGTRPPGSTPAASRIYDLPAAHSDQLCAASGAWRAISGTAPNGGDVRACHSKGIVTERVGCFGV
jgi:hypothetical protein